MGSKGKIVDVEMLDDSVLAEDKILDKLVSGRSNDKPKYFSRVEAWK